MSEVQKINVLMSGDVTDFNNKMASAADKLKDLEKKTKKEDDPGQAMANRLDKIATGISYAVGKATAITAGLLDHNFTQAFSNVGAMAGDAARAIGNVFGPVGGVIAGIFGTAFDKVGALAGTIFDKAFEGLSRVADGGKLATRLGISPEATAGLLTAFQRKGMDSDDAGKMMAKWTDDLIKADLHGGELAKKLKLMGLSAQDLSKMTADKSLTTFMDKLGDRNFIGAGQAQLWADDTVGGKLGRKFLDMANTKDRFGKGESDANKFGLDLSEESVATARRVKAAWTDVTLSLQGMWQKMGVFLAPVFETIAEKITTIIISIREKMEWLMPFFQSGTTGIGELWAVLGEEIDLIFMKLGQFAGQVFLQVIPAAAVLGWENMIALLEKKWEISLTKMAKKFGEFALNVSTMGVGGKILNFAMNDKKPEEKKPLDDFNKAWRDLWKMPDNDAMKQVRESIEAHRNNALQANVGQAGGWWSKFTSAGSWWEKAMGNMEANKDKQADLIRERPDLSPHGAEQGSAAAMSIIAAARRQDPNNVAANVLNIVDGLKVANKELQLIRMNGANPIQLAPAKL